MIAPCVRWVIDRESVSYIPLCLGESQTELPHLWVNVAATSPAGVPTELAALSLCLEHVSRRFGKFCRNVAELHQRCRAAAGVPLRDDMRAVVGLASYVHVEAEMPRDESDAPEQHEKRVPATELARRLDWATLLMRVFAIDVLECPKCEGRMRVLALISQPDVIERILSHLGLPVTPPSASRGPPPAWRAVG